MQEQTEMRELPVRLTDFELKEKSDQLVTTIQVLDGVRGERDDYLAAVKEAKATFNEREKELEKQMRELGREIANRSEHRQVECRLVFYWELGRVESVRLDTGETVHSRPITAEERQQKMPFATASAENADATEEREPLKIVASK
jgi:hypothetical protein